MVVANSTCITAPTNVASLPQVHDFGALPSSSGSFAKFTAIRQASIFVSRSVRPRRPGSSSK